jgi:hypothetical protein
MNLQLIFLMIQLFVVGAFQVQGSHLYFILVEQFIIDGAYTNIWNFLGSSLVHYNSALDHYYHTSPMQMPQVDEQTMQINHYARFANFQLHKTSFQ